MPDENKPWFHSRPAEVPRTIQYPTVPLYEILEKTAREHPEKTAIAYRDKQISYAELDALSDRFATGLASLSVKKGDGAALFLPNIPQFIIAYYGILKAGAVVTAISPLHREREVEYQLNDSEAETIVTLESLYPIVDKVWSKTRLKHVVVTSPESFTSKPEVAPDETRQEPNVHPFQQLLKQDAASPNVEITPAEDLAALQYTGGTTGTAKGAMLTHANLVANTLAFASWIRGATAEETFLTALPLFHIYEIGRA